MDVMSRTCAIIDNVQKDLCTWSPDGTTAQKQRGQAASGRTRSRGGTGNTGETRSPISTLGLKSCIYSTSQGDYLHQTVQSKTF